MQKFEIVNALIAHHRYRSYLEICTPLTGFRFARVDRSRLKRCHRIMYNSPPEFDDGHEITFRSEDEHVGDLLDPAARYDLIFVDPHHTFECSLRDLNLASHLLEPGGTIVVHDCSPPFRESASASFRRGSWCGLTYCAYIQFVLSHPELDYYTVDSDFGCGIIKKQQVATTVDGKTSTERRKLLQGWKVEEQRGGEMFDYFLAHRGELLNLISVKEFLAREKIELPLTLRIAQELRRLLWVLRCAAKRALALWVIRQIPGQKKIKSSEVVLDSFVSASSSRSTLADLLRSFPCGLLRAINCSGSGLTANRKNLPNASELYPAFDGVSCSSRPALCYRPLLAFPARFATRRVTQLEPRTPHQPEKLKKLPKNDFVVLLLIL